MAIEELVDESTGQKKECSLCKETLLKVGEKTEYGAVIIFKIGKGQNGWFATLSPKTDESRKENFTLQLMPLAHLTHFAQISKYPELAENYGIAFAKLSTAMAELMAEDAPEFKATAHSKGKAISIATYGKCTNWAEKKEHLHIKIFPFKGNIGQPYTVDSSFGRKEIFEDNTGKSFVKMNPVKKTCLPEKRLEDLSARLIKTLAE